MPEYKVQLDVYNGPLDLLLYLIRRSELDIYDIPIAEVTRQYCEYVACLHQIDPDAAAEFLVLAAMLMEIKSRMLLPRPPAEEGGGELEELADPRMELVRQLLEYKKFKDASLELGTAAAMQAARWPRSPVVELAGNAAAYDLDDVQIWDLVAAFNQLMVAIGRDRATHDVVFDDTPIALHATDIQDRLNRDGAMAFTALFAGRGRAEMIGLFLALLELIRQKRVRVEQTEVAAPIMVIPLSFDPITVGTEWEYRIAAEEAVVEDSEEPAAIDERPAATGDPALTLAVQEEDELDDVLAQLDQIKTDVEVDLTGDGEPESKKRRGGDED